MRKIEPSVTFKRAVLRTICETAAANQNEVAGLLVGRSTGAWRWRIEHHLPLATVFSSPDEVWYEEEQVLEAKRRALEYHPPNEGLGMWHSHPWDEAQAVCLMPQLDSEDKRNIVPGEMACIAVAFPKPDFKLPTYSNFCLQRGVGSRIVRVEIWHKDMKRKVRPCVLKLV